ncbi:hypothetical protein, partial [[Eubacterium] cellulosolvens]
EEVRGNTTQTFGIFNNHFRGYAPENCIQMMKMLGVADERREATLERIQMHIDGKSTPTTEERITLDRFT